LKAALQTIWEELPQEHINKAVANFTKRLTAYMAVAANAITLSISKHALSSHQSSTNRLFSETPTDYW